jgi:hypothetical protein
MGKARGRHALAAQETPVLSQRAMAQALDLLHKYASTFRGMINSKVWSSKHSIRRLLKLNKDSDWDFLTAAMDIIDDASAAIANVQRFGLSGPTKHDDLGEKYLRLYGLLSATYIQQQSVLTIFQIMNVPDVKKTRRAFDALQIRKLRHKLSSHGTDYLNEAGTKEAYVPLRFDLGDKDITAIRHATPIHHEKVNISEAIAAHINLMITVMDVIVEKSIKTLFTGQDKKQGELRKELSDLRVEKAGGFVFKGPKGAPKIIVTFVGAK